MNIREAQLLLGAGASAVGHRFGDVPAIPVDEFRRLIDAAAENPPTSAAALALAADGDDLLTNALGHRRPRTSAPYVQLAALTHGVLRDVADAAARIPVDAGLCPCITERLWHPAIALACALITTPNDDRCAAVDEAMREPAEATR